MLISKEGAQALKMATIDKWLKSNNEKTGKKMLLGFAKVRSRVQPPCDRDAPPPSQSRFSVHRECCASAGDGLGPGVPLQTLTRDQLGARLKEWHADYEALARIVALSPPSPRAATPR